MAGDLAQQIERAQGWLATQKWKLRVTNDFRPHSDIRTIERFLVGVPRELLHGLIAHLVATATETNLQLEGQQFTGTWAFTRHRWERESPQDDNSLIFVQTLQQGAGVTGAYVVENGCAYLITQTFYWDVAALPTPTAGTSGIEYSLQGVSRDRETGRYSCVIEKREQITQTIAQYVTEEGAAEQVKEAQFLGVRDGDKDHTGAAVGLQVMTLVAGFIKSRRRKKNANCTQDIVEQSREGIDQTSASWDKSHAETVAETLATQSATTETEPAAPAALTVVEVSQEPTLFGRMRKRLRTRTAINQAATDYVKGHAEDVTEVKATQGDEITEPASPAALTIVEVVQEPTIFGKFRRALRTRTAKNQTATDYVKGHAENVSEAKATQGDVIADPGTPAALTIVEVVQEPTIFGKFRSMLRTRTAVNQAATDYVKGHAEDVTEVKATQGDEITEPASPAALTIVEVVQEPTIFGKFRRALRTRTAKNQTATDYVKGHAENVSEAKATQGDVIADPGTPAALTIVEVVQEPTIFGKFRSMLRTRTAVNQAATDYVKGHAEDVTEVKATQGDEITEPASPAALTIVEVVQEPTIFGKFRSMLRTRTAKNQTATGGETRADVTRSTATATHAAAAASATRSAGEIAAAAIVRADSRPTPFGTYATERMVETPAKLVKTFTVHVGEKITAFANHTVDEVTALLANVAVVPSGWTPALGIQWTGYLTTAGECLWNGTIRAGSPGWTRRAKWEDFSETGIVESSFVIREFNRKLYKVVRTETYNYVGDSGIDAGLTAYKALAPKDGSWFRPNDGQDYYVYKAVTGVTITATDITSAFEAGTAITI